MQQQFTPNYMNKLKAKKLEQKEQKERLKPKKKFMNVDFDIKGEEELNYYQIY